MKQQTRKDNKLHLHFMGERDQEFNDRIKVPRHDAMKRLRVLSHYIQISGYQVQNLDFGREYLDIGREYLDIWM